MRNLTSSPTCRLLRQTSHNQSSLSTVTRTRACLLRVVLLATLVFLVAYVLYFIISALDVIGVVDAVALTFSGRYKRSGWRFCACAIYVKSSMCSEKTKHLWYQNYGMFVRMYITSQQSYLSQINTRQTRFEAYFDSKRKSHDSSAP